MLSKISRLSLSLKLTILYVWLLFMILLFTSLLTVAALYHGLSNQTQNDIAVTSNNLINYLTDNPLNQQLLDENLLDPEIIVKIRNEKNQLIIDTAPYLNDNAAVVVKSPLASVLFPSSTLTITKIQHTYFYSASYQLRQAGQIYQLRLLKPLTEQTHFLQTLIKVLAITTLVGLLVALLAGIVISRRVLSPLHSITATAKEIQFDSLNQRIPISNSSEELHELAQTFNHMLTRIQTGIEQQRRFVADASHELRTPITVISGYINMLDRWGKQDQAALEEGLAAIKSETENMHDLIEKLLFLARADQGQQVLQKTSLNLAPFMEAIAQETRLIAPNHQVILDRNDPLTIVADSNALKQMLRIFIENSIKYTPSGGYIYLASRQVGQISEISITDTGIGIALSEQAKIFDRFYRIDRSRTKHTGGTGLGLAIARWIAEQHGYVIMMTSIPEQGTQITLRLRKQN